MSETVDGRVQLERERAAGMRVRFAGVALVSAAIWFSHWYWYEAEIFPSRQHSHIYRVGELLACSSLVFAALTVRRLRWLEWTGTALLCALTLLHGFALLVIADSCFVPFLLTLEWGNVVIALAAALSLRPSVAYFGVTWLVGVLATRLRSGFDADLTDHLVLCLIYLTVCLSIRNYDRSRLAAHLARAELAAANEALKRADAARSRLFENLSHDFRTPLALIDGDAQRLAQAPRDAETAQALQRMRANAGAMADLIDQLLLMAKLDVAEQAPDVRVLDVGVIAREVLAQFDGGPQRGKLRLELPQSPAQLPVLARADAAHLRRILHNLLSNAVRQLARGANHVWLELGVSEDTVSVEVGNDGPPIAPAQRERIFERFASFDASGNVASGIGLPLARELAELNAGRLHLSAEEHTVFCVTLPRAEAGAMPQDAAGANPSAFVPALEPAAALHQMSSAKAAEAERRRLLVVEDTPEMAELLAAMLGDQYEVRIAGSVQGALESAAAVRPDVLLVDLMLPDGSGLRLLEELPRVVSGVAPPMVFLSAAADPQVRVEALSRGAADFLLKPFAAEELRARLAVVTRAADELEESLRRQREDLAAELHDGVNSALARAAMLLEGAERRPRPELVPLARAAVLQALDQARSLSVLRGRVCVPLAVAASELELSLRSALAGFDVRCGLTTSFDGSLAALTGVEQHTLERLAVEACTNGLKHGSPRQIDCTLTILDGSVELVVTSDGSEQARTNAGELSSGAGISLARARLERLGGRICSEAGDQGRWTVSATFAGALGHPRRPAPMARAG